MKNVTLYFIRRPMLVNFILALNFILGGYFIYKVPKEAFPGVSLNQIMIVTKYPGASSKDVELNITAKIEEKVAEIGNIKEYFSSSIEGLSRIVIFANDDLSKTQFKDLLMDIRSGVDRVDDLPSDIEGKPVVTSVTTEDRPIMEIAFTGTYEILKNKLPQIEDELRKISGVSNITIVGLPDEEIHIEVDAKKAFERDVDLNSIYYAIKTRNQVGTGGVLESLTSQKKIVSFNKYEKAEDVLNTVIRMSADGEGVYLSDVASITYRPKNEKLRVRNNGKRGATILVAIRSGIDQLKVSDKIKKLLKKKKLPSGSSYRINNDISDNAKAKFTLLKNNGFIGFLLVLLLLLYFFGTKAAFWTAFGIPFSIFGSMILFVPMGMTLNTVSMGAFVIVLGMIVDDAMVISERFDVNIEKGESPEEAASNSVASLWKPVLAASLTTVTAFLPLLALGGLPGKFIWQMPAVVVIALFVSLIDCYLLLPAHLANGKIKKGGYKKNKIVIIWENTYEKILLKVLKYRYLTVLSFFALLVFSFFIGSTKLKKESFPQEASEGFFLKVTLEKGVSSEKAEEIIKSLEKSIEEFKKNELIGYTTRLGTHDISSLTSLGTEENLVTFLVYLSPYSDREKTARDLIRDVKKKNLKKFKEKGYELDFSLMRIGPPLGEPFEIIISSNENKARKMASEKVIKFLEKIKGTSEIKDDYIPGKDEINLKLDYKKVAQAGLTPVDIIRTLRIAFDGQIVTDFSSVNQSYNFRLRLDKKSRKNLNFISKLPISNKRGQLIKLDTMIDYEQRSSFSEIKHYNGLRSTSVTGHIDSKKISAIEILSIFQSEFPKDENIKYTISGRPVEEKKIFSGLKTAALLAIIGIYFILSLMFNSYAKPILILSVIPFGVVGIFLSFYLHGLPISMFAGIGLIGLAGIVVNDSIILVDHITQMMKKNKSFSKKLLVQGAKERLRPILLTTISTVLAIFPTAYAIGGYDPLLSPLSLAILYGLLFGTIVVIFFLPALYLIGTEWGERIKGIKIKNANTFLRSMIFLTGFFHVQNIYAQEILSIKKIIKILKVSNEYKIQDENVKQARYKEVGVEGMLDAKVISQIFKYSSSHYPNPPVTLDSEREGFGFSVDYEKLTSYGLKVGLGLSLEDKELKTIPRNNKFSLDAIDRIYKVSLSIPLLRNFSSKEYHYSKKTASIRRAVREYKVNLRKDNLKKEAISSYWYLVKLIREEKIAKNSLNRFTRLHKQNIAKYKSGIINKAELLTTEVEIMSRRKKYSVVSSKIKAEKINLNSILEIKKRTKISIDSMKVGRLISNLSENTIKELIGNGTLFVQAGLSKKASESLLDEVKEKEKNTADFFISLKSVGRGLTPLDSIKENSRSKHEIYAGIKWGFDFTGIKRKSSINRALSEKRQALMRENQLKMKLSRGFYGAREKLRSNDREIFFLKKIIVKKWEILKAEKKRFKNGKLKTIDFVRLEESYDTSLLEMIGLEYFNELMSLNLFNQIGRLERYLSYYQ